MKSLIKVNDLNTSSDVKNIREAIASNEGVVACEISVPKKEVSVVYDDFSVKLDQIIESIEEIGYTVL